MVDIASDAGADLEISNLRCRPFGTKDAKKADYQIALDENSESQYKMLSRLELTEEYKEPLFIAKEKSVFFSFDIKSLDFLFDLGLNHFKIPSGELTNLPYLRHIGRFKNCNSFYRYGDNG